MATLGISVLGLSQALGKLADLPAKLDAAEQRATTRGALHAVRIWRQKVRGPVLKVRSGEYRAGINQGQTTRTESGYEARVGVREGAASRYAAIHETGGTIRPKGHPFLTIPLDRTKAGVARDKSPRDYPDGFFFTSKAGNRLFGIRDGAGVLPLFVLKTEVTIPARRPMGQTLDEVRPIVASEFATLLRQAVG